MSRQTVRIFLTGDVMLGRGIDQILASPCKPHLHESYVKDARVYVEIAEQRNGKMPPKEITSQPPYIWGSLLQAFRTYEPDIKLLNLETSITDSEDNWPSKGINYRMHPSNVYTLRAIQHERAHSPSTPSLSIAQKTDMYNDDTDNKQELSQQPEDATTKQTNLVCNLANNHVLDWGYSGLHQTLSTLRTERILFCGAGENVLNAWEPAVVTIPDRKCRIFTFGVGTESSGCPKMWNASHNKAGIAMTDPYDRHQVPIIMKHIKEGVTRYKTRNGIDVDHDVCKDIMILSIHWGSNWGFDISSHFQRFAHDLIDYADKHTQQMKIRIDLIHGHSSHHIKALEVYKGKPIFYGCGDFLSDYEGITGNEYHNSLHDDLSFAYFVDLDCESGDVEQIILKGTKVRNFQIQFAQQTELQWLHKTIQTQCGKFGVPLAVCSLDNTLRFNAKNETKLHNIHL